MSAPTPASQVGGKPKVVNNKASRSNDDDKKTYKNDIHAEPPGRCMSRATSLCFLRGYTHALSRRPRRGRPLQYAGRAG